MLHPGVATANGCVARACPTWCRLTAAAWGTRGSRPPACADRHRGGRSSKGVRRCPTLPQGHPCSTIGAESLSFRVRNVTGRFPLAMAAETLLMFRVVHTNGVPVHRERQSGREQQSCDSYRITSLGSVLSSYRLISTGQLHRSLVPASTSGLSTQSSTGSLSPEGMEISS